MFRSFADHITTAGIWSCAIPKFHKLRAVSAHEGFHDERPLGPDADRDLVKVFRPLRHSVEELD
jgi:hypothetical protein